MAKLLFVSHTANLGAGSNQSLLKLLKYLRASHHIEVVVHSTGEFLNTLRSEKIPYTVLRKRWRYYIPSLMYLILRGKFDLVYGNNYSNRSVLALMAAWLTRRPYVWHVREVLDRGVKFSQYLQYADVIIANSHSTEKSIRLNDVDGDILVIPNGIDLEDFAIERNEAKNHVCNSLGIPNDSIVVVNIGRVCEQKNQLEAVEAIIEVAKKHPLVVLCFLGNFQDLDYVERIKVRVNQLGIQYNVRLLGFKNNTEVYLRGADILLHTSRKESQGRIVLEAMASGIPVVAYDVGGIGESVVPEQTGYLIPFGDVPGVVQTMNTLVADLALRKVMGKAGRQRVEKLFTAEKTAQQVDNVIGKILRG